jgi:hypothetical protein
VDDIWLARREADGRVRLEMQVTGATVTVLLDPADAREIGESLVSQADGTGDGR